MRQQRNRGPHPRETEGKLKKLKFSDDMDRVPKATYPDKNRESLKTSVRVTLTLRPVKLNAKTLLHSATYNSKRYVGTTE